jgi:hypothetical protein
MARAYNLPATYTNELEEEEEEDENGEKKEREDKRIKCAICTDALCANERVLSGECCTSLFHTECIKPYNDSKCPTCRQNLLNSMPPNIPK